MKALKHHSYPSNHIRIFIATAAAVVLIALALLISGVRAGAAPAEVQPLTPIAGSTVTSSVSLSSKVSDLTPDQYEMFWAVGQGQWNRMSTNASTGVSSDTIDISGWNWNADGNYQIRFIALVKSDWHSVESSVNIHKGSVAAPATTPAPAPAPVQSAPLVTPPKSPIQTALYVDSESTPAQSLASGNASASTKFIAAQPLANWFGNWNTDVQKDVSAYIHRASSSSAIPTLVLYNIPHRDCGSYSGNGLSDYNAYQQWIKTVASAIGPAKSIVILEPDALAAMDCLSATDQTARMAALSAAVTTLSSNTGTSVYIDAGHPQWQSPQTMATRLKAAGIASATGFSLNVSNFETTSNNTTYGTAISSLVGNKHFVIDTSRNGNGPSPTYEWCNPSGRALGNSPTFATGNSLIDAYLWIKTPGASDGACGNGAPGAGQWWQAYADELYRNK